MKKILEVYSDGGENIQVKTIERHYHLSCI